MCISCGPLPVFSIILVLNRKFWTTLTGISTEDGYPNKCRDIFGQDVARKQQQDKIYVIMSWWINNKLHKWIEHQIMDPI